MLPQFINFQIVDEVKQFLIKVVLVYLPGLVIQICDP